MKSEKDIQVSVIIPAYNAGDVIEGALRSVKNQSCLQEGREGIEVIVVDDASTDNTLTVVENLFSRSEFRLHISDFSLLQQSSNSGPAAARNRGVAEARGEWVAFIDSDDTWLPEKLERQLKFAEAQPEIHMWCGAVQSTCTEDRGRRIEGSGEMLEAGIVQEASGQQRPSDLRIQNSEFTGLSLEDFVAANPVATSSVLVKKAALDAVGGFDERFSGAEDYDLWLRLIGSGRCKAAKINRPLIKYHSESGSLSMDERRFLPDALQVLDKAFGPGGALEPFADRKNCALANQYWNASWMAFNRGDCREARRLLCKGWCLSSGRLKRPWLRLFLRYLIGSR